MFTHTGYIKGCDGRTPDNYQRKVKLRATKTMWIAEEGSRWRRDDGARIPRNTWPMYRLDIDTITESPSEGTAP